MDRPAVARLLARATARPEPGLENPTRFGPNNQDRVPRDVDMVARQRRVDPSVAVQRVEKTQPAGGKNVKTRQAWKYPGGNIVRAPSVNINGRYYTDPKEDEAGDEKSQGDIAPFVDVGTPRRKQESNFFITINPNQKYSADLEGRARNRFVAALAELQENDVLARCLKFGPKSLHYVNDHAHDVLLPGIDWKATVEIGEDKHRMHAHIICYIQHYSQIQIAPKILQHEFRRAFNKTLALGDPLRLTTLPYVQAKLLPQSDWTTIMRQYIRKGMTA